MKRILWFRRDLRVEDNPLLSLDGDVLPIFIFDTNILESLNKDDKRLSFIFYYVKKLKQELLSYGLNLKIFYGKPEIIFEYLLKENSFYEVVASPDYDSYAKERDLHISHKLPFHYIEDTYIFKTDEISKDDGTPYLVFTPFYKKARALLESKDIQEYEVSTNSLIETDYDVITKINETMNVSKVAIKIQNKGFEEVILNIVEPHLKLKALKNKIDNYKEQRDYFSIDASSNLSVDIRFGTIGIREVLRFVFSLKSSGTEPFIRQLIFRDFYAYLLFHFPNIEYENYKYSFNGIKNNEMYELFCSAKTGVPIIDAGVRELLQTGNIHNRVRMIIASFFTKDLLLPWQWGEKFFAKYLLDYDKASNVLSWQWSAGTGVDPQPYFRVFNPYLQSKKYDKDALYIKKYIPELFDIESKYLHDEEYLFSTNIQDYPKPIVVHKEVAKKAVEIFKEYK
ncbi:cryptochrome/photolyase family protein [Candidatus Sulfurimonas baltica]|uniref:Deoxyribodipyrimidine photo-lyase n=1 Tax=Candidatus Sulfurimonas baltica TaxID=2740404 RepID=A0A7S7LW92_9BACT|nr:deoxyribodipyrimidine photo-lyase [Candidatus Sulfurimonas baltica]QOY52510.1 deoxyribodipyrimidine photo-lyase [Candidatus Sulfurimonas baltica]